VKEQLKQYDLMFEEKFNKIPSRSEKEPLRPLYMYYKKLKQGIIHSKNVRKSSVASRKQEVLWEKEENKVQSQRRSYEGLNKVQRLQSETSSVTSRGKENINVNIRHSHDNYSLKEKDESKIRKLMKQRESFIKVNLKNLIILGAEKTESCPR